jgi:integrase
MGFCPEHGPIGYKRWAQAFRKAAKLANIQGATLHGQRHSILSLLRDKGGPTDKLQAAFGWVGTKMLDNYTHTELFDYTSQQMAVDELMGQISR